MLFRSEFFKDRSLFYFTFPFREQAVKGSDWDFQLNHVYTVALLNFDMKDEAFDADAMCHYVKLCDTTTHKVFYEKLDFIFVEISKFQKSEDELETFYDKWLYVLKNLSVLTNRPKALRDKVFDRLFEEAEIARFTPRELREYEDSCKAYRDLKNSLDTALRQGHAKGLEEGLAKGREEGLAEGHAQGLEEGLAQGYAALYETAKKLKERGESSMVIQELTGLPLDVIENF